jgi:tetratricopeptide (TPR) repeat protein
LNLGIVLVQQQRFSEAAQTLEKAISLQPDSPSARLYAGLALGSLNDLAGAERELKTAHNLGGPAFAVALFNLGVVYQRRGERQAALEMFEGYIREAPKASNVAHVKKLIETLRQADR